MLLNPLGFGTKRSYNVSSCLQGWYFGSVVQKYEGILKKLIWEQQWMGKVSRNNDLNFSLVLTQRYCVASEDLKYSTFGACTTCSCKMFSFNGKEQLDHSAEHLLFYSTEVIWVWNYMRVSLTECSFCSFFFNPVKPYMKWSIFFY